jgi:hypothetical protein
MRTLFYATLLYLGLFMASDGIAANVRYRSLPTPTPTATKTATPDPCPGLDHYEPDDTQAQAKWMPGPGVALNHYFCEDGDVDWKKFYIDTPNTRKRMSSANLGASCDTVMGLYKEDGTLLAEDDDSGGLGASQISYIFSQTGIYYLKFRNKLGSLRGGRSSLDTRYDAVVQDEVVTSTPTNVPTSTPSSTPSVTPTIEATLLPTSTATPTPSSTPTSTGTMLPTNTPTIDATLTPTNTPEPTPSPTPTPPPVPSFGFYGLLGLGGIFTYLLSRARGKS